MYLPHQTLRLALILFCLSPHLASADTRFIKMSILPVLTNPIPNATCPKSVEILETPQPYREGSFATNGKAQLNQLAEDFSILSTDEFSVTWIANLKPLYRNCRATGSNIEGFSYLRLRFLDGKVYLILDMTGVPDANQYTIIILHKGVQNGNPIWTWGGTD